MGLNTLEKQTEITRRRVEIENEIPPKYFEKRKQKYDEWRKKVG